MGDAAFIIPRMRLRPHSTAPLSRPYERNDLPQKKLLLKGQARPV